MNKKLSLYQSIHRLGLLLTATALLAAACGPSTPVVDSLPTLAPLNSGKNTTQAVSTSAPVPQGPPIYADSSRPVEERVDDLLARMTVDEKIGQMTQVQKNSISPKLVTRYGIGSLLSGGGGYPADNSPEGWAEMIDTFQEAALATRLGIPIIYGVDAVHGHNNVRGATIFPHNIGLGATRDPDLLYRIGQATAIEMDATGARLNFAPVLAVVQDIRWGRTYESYGENTELVSELGRAYVRGLQSPLPDADGEAQIYVLATPKHYIGDGATVFGAAKSLMIAQICWLDQGDMQVDEQTLRAKFLPPYEASLDEGAMSVMASFSSWNGAKMHGQEYLLTGVLKNELGFNGFVISDWAGIDQLPGSYYNDVVNSINAGMDMVMVPDDYQAFIENLSKAVSNGDIPMARIDDAVRRILRVKMMLGLFEQPYADPEKLAMVGSEAHRQLGREAVSKSLVLLKNSDQTLPIAADTNLIYVGGQAADDIGIQSGGWTIEWQGKVGQITPGATILDGIYELAGPNTQVEYDRFGRFSNGGEIADIGIAVVGETPYAECVGDRDQLNLSGSDSALIAQMRKLSKRLVVVVVSGRPLVITEQLPEIDALVAAWLPGTEGQGVADGLFGNTPFTGRLSFSWPRWSSQLPLGFTPQPSVGCEAPLFSYGYGLSAQDPSPDVLVCPKE